METNTCFGQIMEEGDKPGFYKILWKKDLSSEAMRGIPHDFIKSIADKDLSAKMVLKVSWGSSWTIKISRNPIFYYMEKSGWDQFLSDNALGNNELLTFTHKGNMLFSVDIYQINSTEMLRPRKSATIASSSCGKKREEESNIYTDVKKEESPSSKLRCLGPKTTESTGRGQILSSGKRKAEEAERSKKKVNTVCNESETNTSSLAPEFTLSIKKAYLVFLGVPKKFSDMHMPKETTKFKIHHLNQTKSWEVTYVVSDIQSRLSAGWIRLARDLGLVVGDVCTFKLIKPTEMLLEVSK